METAALALGMLLHVPILAPSKGDIERPAPPCIRDCIVHPGSGRDFDPKEDGEPGRSDGRYMEELLVDSLKIR